MCVHTYTVHQEYFIPFQQIPKEVIPIIEFVMRDLDKYFGDLGKEMTSIAEYAGIDLGMVVGLNIALELRRVS